MKKWMLLAVCVMFSIIGFSQGKKLKDMVGRWEIAGEPNAFLEVIDSATISLTYMGETRQITNLKTDFSKTPCWFDFSTKDSSSVVQVKSLVEIIGDNMLKWQLFIDEDRSPYFTTSKGEILYLKKKPLGITATASSN
jgi:hypothetical protein